MSDGASARVSRTVAYRFLDREWPLPDDWAGVRSPTAEVVRSFVAAGGRFVMVGRLEDGPNGLGIVGSSADGLRVEAGSMEAIRARQQRLGRIEAWAWLPLLLAGLSLLLRVRRIRGEFEVRSNATRPVAR